MRFVFMLALCFCSAHAAVSFKEQVAPILLEKCVMCHGAEKSKGGFRLDTFAALMKAGDSQKTPITAGAPERSHLFELLTTTDEDDRMPQKSDRLAAEQIALIRDWIREGAKFDGAAPEQNLAALIPFQAGPEPLDHYAFPQPIFALAWSPDGKTLASSGYHEVLIWNVDGKLERRVSRLPERIHGLAFTDAETLAVAAGTPGKSGEILLCCVSGCEIPKLLARLNDVATCIAIDKGRTLLAAGGADNSIRIFELPSGKERFAIQQHADWVTALCFSPDGTKLASASRDRTARVFDVKKGELLETYAEHDQPLFAVAFSENGKTVFSGGREKRSHAWQANEGKKIGEFPPLDGETLAFYFANGHLFATGSDRGIHEFDENRKRLRTLKGHNDWVYSLAWHEGSKRLASGSYDGEIRIWDLEKGIAQISFKAAP